MDKVMYRGTQQIKGSILSDNGKIVVIQLDAGGTMSLDKDDVQLLPSKEAKRKAKKDYKQANNTEVSEG